MKKKGESAPTAEIGELILASATQENIGAAAAK